MNYLGYKQERPLDRSSSDDRVDRLRDEAKPVEDALVGNRCQEKWSMPMVVVLLLFSLYISLNMSTIISWT